MRKNNPWLLLLSFGMLVALNGCGPKDEVGLCDNEIDDDEDGVTDCDDEECAADDFCDVAGDCANPDVLTDPGTATGDTTGAADSADGSCQGDGAPDAVFTVTPTAELLSVTLTPQNDADLGFFLQTTCGDAGTEIECEDLAVGGQPEEADIAVTPGQPIFLIVSGFQVDDFGPFTLSVSSRDIVCGDGQIDGNEECDDAGTAAGDGCDAACLVEDGFDCNGEPSVCELICGDGFVDVGEECDDDNNTDGDGCAADCTVENGFICDGFPSVCADITAECAAAVTAQAAGTNGDTTNGSDKFAPQGCGGGTGPENVFVFTPQAADISITATPADPNGAFDPVVYAYSGNCVDTNEIDCIDAGFGGDAETLALTGLTVGQPITIIVDSFSDNGVGAYVLTIQ